MRRIIFSAAAMALGSALALSGSAQAADQPTSGFYGGAVQNSTGNGTTMTLGGHGTPAQAAAATEDLELTRGGGGRGGAGGRGGFGGGYGRAGYGGYGRGYGGYGYGGYGRGWGYGGWGYGGWGGWGWGGWGWPYYWPYYGYGYGYPYYGGVIIGANVGGGDFGAPSPYLNAAVAQNPLGTQSVAINNGLRYDGGPANPVPATKADPTTDSSTIHLGNALPVSLTKTKPANPYTFKAYGEK